MAGAIGEKGKSMRNLQAASSIDLASLAMRARDAYNQKRTKECLTLTKSLLMADPGNAEGTSLQSAIRSDIQRNLDDARVLLEDSRRHDNLPEHRKAAEILLLKILYLDPENEEARILLNSGKDHSGKDNHQPVAFPAPAPRPASVSAPASVVTPVAPPNASNSSEPAFAVEYRRIEKATLNKSRTKVPVILAASAVLAGVLIVTGQSHFRKAAAAPPPASIVRPKQPEIPKAIVPVSNQNPYTETAVPELLTKNAPPSLPKEVPAAFSDSHGGTADTGCAGNHRHTCGQFTYIN